MRPLRFTPTLSALAVFAATAPVWAAEGEKKGGLPQLDMSYYPGQIFWLAVTFALLYTVMAWIVIPSVQRTQKKRQSIIEAELASADDASESAKRTIEEYEAALVAAHVRAQAIHMDGVAKFAKETAGVLAEQQEVLTRQVLQAEIRIGNARDAALLEIKKTYVELADGILDKVTNLKIRAEA